MKLQLTALATAVSLSMSGAAFAQETIVSDTNLNNEVDWGVDSQGPSDGSSAGYDVDNENWDNNFGEASGSLSELSPGEPTGPGLAGSNNRVSIIDQTGDYNQADVTQAMHRSYSRVEQEGNGLSAHVNQIGLGNYSLIQQTGEGEGNVVNVTQTQAYNDSIVYQYGGINNLVDVSQYGGNEVGNDSTVQQGIEGEGGANYNKAFVTQSGGENSSYIKQVNGEQNEAQVTQTGDLNKSYIGQSGSFNEAYALQAGVSGTSYIIQEGDNNYASLNQTAGSYDESYILQNSSGMSEGHIAEVTQTNTGESANISTITQVSNEISKATVTQNGSGNWASTIQY